MKLMNNSQQEWLNAGGSPEALSFINGVVGALHQKALNEGIIHKDTETSNEVEDSSEVEPLVEEETETKEVDATENEVEQVEETVPTEESSTEVSFAEVLTETIFAAQKQYHETVVAPLLVEIKSLKEELASKKSYSNLFNLEASDLLPAAAVAARISKEFTQNETELSGDTSTQEPVLEKEITSLTDANLFANF